MEVSSFTPQSIYSSSQIQSYNAKAELDGLVIKNTVESLNEGKDRVSVGIDEVYKNLTVTAQEIVRKLNDMLGDKLPNGIESLRPQDVTPEATADRIVTGATAFFGVFRSQNPDLQGDELVDKFMEAIKGGIKSGYDDAVSILDGLGAFEFEGVQSSIEETMTLVDKKLKSFEELLKKQLSNERISEDIASEVSSEFSELGGFTIYNSSTNKS